MLCYIDAEWSMNRHNDEYDAFVPFFRVQREFVKSCNNYKKAINDNYEDFCSANRTKSKKKLSSYLFNPISYFPLARSDHLSIVLLDDFDPIYHMTSELTTTIWFSSPPSPV